MSEELIQSLEERIEELEARVQALEDAGGACLFDDCHIETVNIYKCGNCQTHEEDLADDQEPDQESDHESDQESDQDTGQDPDQVSMPHS